jgi:hypothetical protein
LKEAAGRSALEPAKMIDEALERLSATARRGSIVWRESVALFEKLRSELSESRSSGKSSGKKIRL